MITAHIENRRLLDMAKGRLRLDEWEHQHLRECNMCQSVLHVFVNYPAISSTENSGLPADAA